MNRYLFKMLLHTELLILRIYLFIKCSVFSDESIPFKNVNEYRITNLTSFLLTRYIESRNELIKHFFFINIIKNMENVLIPRVNT